MLNTKQRSHEILCQNLDELDAFAEQLATNLRPKDIIALSGQLGAGKTTLTKFLIKHLHGNDEVTSPTFSYVHRYEAAIPLYHFDLYRLENEDQFLDLGLDEYLFEEAICVIEWPEKIIELLPISALCIDIQVLPNQQRKCIFNSNYNGTPS